MSTQTRALIRDKNTVARNEKRNKQLFTKNIVNFEVFWGVKNFSKKLLFLRSVLLIDQMI